MSSRFDDAQKEKTLIKDVSEILNNIKTNLSQPIGEEISMKKTKNVIEKIKAGEMDIKIVHLNSTFLAAAIAFNPEKNYEKAMFSKKTREKLLFNKIINIILDIDKTKIKETILKEKTDIKILVKVSLIRYIRMIIFSN